MLSRVTRKDVRLEGLLAEILLFEQMLLNLCRLGYAEAYVLLQESSATESTLS